jgi:ATP-dependent DNA helicase RecG
MFDSSDIALLKKIKKRTLLDLALTLPSSYSDSSLSKEINEGKTLTTHAKVINSRFVNGKLYIEFDLSEFNTKATGVFYRVSPYHQKIFAIGSSHVISGRVNYFRGELQISQPKSLKNYGVVETKYKTPLKPSEIKSLITKYITKENLLQTGLEEAEVDTLLTLHFPKTLDDVMENGELKKEHKEHLKAIECYNHMMKLRKKRFLKPALKALQKDISEFLNALSFTLTNDQLKAIKDIQSDLANKTKAAKRLIVGDVGSGKTMVILASAFIAAENRAILMAPTSLLANQLFEEAQKYLGKFLKIALLTQKSQINDYKEADFIIGTHALLYKEDLGEVALVMVDEQHRFGTNQRAMLEAMFKKEEKSPHYLQFSATPIPRTQAMIESNAIDISTIKQLPFKKEIETKIINRSNFKELLSTIKEKIAKNEQTLIIYPLVEPSDEVPYMALSEALSFWEKNFEGVYHTHGKDKNKDEVLLEFREKGNILLATTVVEVGISLPRLTNIVIVGAERFGLATLHQLRGRVGRYGIKSDCYLFTNASTPPKRLIEFAKTLDGFEIARLDLKYRDSGDLLDGTIQSGKAFKWLDLSEDEAIVEKVKKRIEKFE